MRDEFKSSAIAGLKISPKEIQENSISANVFMKGQEMLQHESEFFW